MQSSFKITPRMEECGTPQRNLLTSLAPNIAVYIQANDETDKDQPVICVSVFFIYDGHILPPKPLIGYR